MKPVHILIPVLLGLSAMLQARELPPPDVTFFGAVESARTDFGGFNIDDEVRGSRLRAGLWLNDVKLGRWKLGVEGAYHRMGESTQRSELERSPTGRELNTISGNLVSVTESTQRELDVGGLEIGTRLYDSELFYLRGGAYLYSFRNRTDRTLTYRENDGTTTTNDLLPQSESSSTLGPYAGAGFAFPVTKTLRVTASMSVYWIESEPLDSMSLGLQFRSK